MITVKIENEFVGGWEKSNYNYGWKSSLQFANSCINLGDNLGFWHTTKGLFKEEVQIPLSFVFQIYQDCFEHEDGGIWANCLTSFHKN